MRFWEQSGGSGREPVKQAEDENHVASILFGKWVLLIFANGFWDRGLEEELVCVVCAKLLAIAMVNDGCGGGLCIGLRLRQERRGGGLVPRHVMLMLDLLQSFSGFQINQIIIIIQFIFLEAHIPLHG